MKHAYSFFNHLTIPELASKPFYKNAPIQVANDRSAHLKPSDNRITLNPVLRNEVD